MKEDFECVLECLKNNPKGILVDKNDLYFLNSIKNYFPNLKETKKRPDAYAIQDDSILLLEHFQFDNSKTSSKGSKQNKISAETQRNFEKKFKEGCNFAVLSESVEKRGINYVENFQTQFNKHAKKINNYKTDIEKELGRTFKKYLMGFVIEESSPLGTSYYDGKFRVVDLTFCKEFLDLFEKTPSLDFVVFAMTENNENKILSFLSRNQIKERRKRQIEVSTIDKFLFEESCCVSGVIPIF